MTDLPEEGGGAGWRHQVLDGTVAELHAAPWPDPVVRTVWRMLPTRPALVLGSTQRGLRERLVGRASRQGFDVVVRGSGGGAVLVEPTAVVWLDLIVGSSDPLWVDDVSRSSLWLGEVWVEALRSLGVPADAVTGPFEPGRWGALVCFAGSAPGEVVALPSSGTDASKLVGISQKRTRLGARFQSMLHLRSDPTVLADLLAGVVDDADRDELLVAAGATAVVDRPGDEVVEAFLAALPTSTGG